VVRNRRFEFERENNVWVVNGKVFDVEQPAIVVRKGTAEIWTLKGKGSWHHPVHIHMEEGRILSRNGRPPAAHEAGRKDVFVLNPADELRIFMRFRDFTGKYMMHCHNTVHEDHAMMLRFDVES
jgi:FtsP/CotA-like multicopper oxidase with cupredoxin domain